MSAIKGVVIGMGVLILAGFIVVAVTLLMRSQGGSEPDRAFQTIVTLPSGARVVETRMTEDRILLRVADAGGAETLVVLDAASGQESGRVTLTVAP